MALCVLHLLACSHAIALLRAQEVQAEKEAKRLEKAAKLAAKRAAALPAPATPAAPCAAEPMTAHVDAGLPLAVAVALPTPVGMPNLARISAQMMAEVAKDA